MKYVVGPVRHAYVCGIEMVSITSSSRSSIVKSDKGASRELFSLLKLISIIRWAFSNAKLTVSSSTTGYHIGFGSLLSAHYSLRNPMTKRKKRCNSELGSFQATSTSRKDNLHQHVPSSAVNTAQLRVNKKYFLLKSEPAEFSIENLCEKRDQTVVWDGVRNHEAKKILSSMSYGDQCFFYHSSCKIPGIVGIVTVVSDEAVMDLTAIDPQHKHYDPKYTKENCPWVAVRVKLDRILPSIISLQQLKDAAANNPSIAQMTLLRRPRLSVSEITEEQWNSVIELNDVRPVSLKINNNTNSGQVNEISLDP